MRQYTPFIGLLAALTACQAGELEPTADEVPDAGTAPVTAPQGNVKPPQRTLLGTTDLGTTVTKTIEVPYHPGASADNVTFSGADADQFSVEDVQCVEGGKCTYTVAFSPDAAGAKSALLSLGTGEGVVPLSKVTGVGLPTKVLANQLLVVQKGVDPIAPGRGLVFEVPDPTLYCDGDCDATMQQYPQGTVVTLRAEAEPGNAFMGWGGVCLGTGSECTVTMSRLSAVTATFRGAVNLSLQPLGAAGVIKSADGKLTCGTDCQEMYPFGSQVTLNYELPPGIAFDSWGGVCSGSGTGPCTVTMNQATDVSAQFRNVLTVVKSGSGTGTVVSKVNSASDGQINCGSDCSGAYPTSNQPIVLEASVNADLAVFDGWQGCPTPNGNLCTLTVNGPKTVTALFRAKYVQRVQVPAGGGSILVQLGFTQHRCTGTCDYRVALNEHVAMRAEPNADKAFDRWGGHCAGETTDTCAYDVTGAHTSSATFQHRYRVRVDTEWRPPQWRVGNGAWNNFTGAPPYNLDFAGTTQVQIRQAIKKDVVNCLQFAGFSGDCGGSACTITVDNFKHVYGHWTEIGGCTPQ
jgi:hypothetical protein